MSKVFIIGAAGKVGRRLVKQLIERGHEAIQRCVRWKKWSSPRWS